VADKPYAEMPAWFKQWEKSSLIAWVDKNGDGLIRYDGSGHAIEKHPERKKVEPVFAGDTRGGSGQRLLLNDWSGNTNELYVDPDIIVLANPEIARLPDWVIGLVAAGGLAAALSTAAGLLLVISTSIAHDLYKKTLNPSITEKGELMLARVAAAVAVVIAGYFGVKPPGFVAEVVAFAFGLAASSFFPAIVMGIFTKRVNRHGAVAGMLCGLLFTLAYIVYFKFGIPFTDIQGVADQYWFGISPEGIGTVGMLLNFAVALTVSRLTAPPPAEIADLVERIRLPRAAFGDADAGPSDH
jgi:cation/acetate symporter